MATVNIESTQLDFEQIKSNLKTYLAAQSEFADFDFEAAGINNILDVLAYNTHFNALNANFALNEAFLNTAQLRSSVVSHAQSLCIIGTSGCGKSVTLKCLLGLIAPDSGSIKIDAKETVGQSRTHREEMLRRFGMTFQFGALFDSLPIWQNITFRLRQNTYLSRQKAREAAAEIVVQLGLEARVIDQYPAELSGGMQKRVALARAIADKPEILLFDEPTSGRANDA